MEQNCNKYKIKALEWFQRFLLLLRQFLRYSKKYPNGDVDCSECNQERSDLYAPFQNNLSDPDSIAKAKLFRRIENMACRCGHPRVKSRFSFHIW
jgi:hypothetical protein